MKTIKPKKERFEIKIDDDIKINARNIDAWNIDAWDIDACNINAWNIDACNINAWNINALNIDARNIDARNIIQIHETKLKVKKKIKCKVLIVYDDCKIECPKIEAEKIVKLKRKK